MAFDIQGNEISYHGIPFATIDGSAWASLRAEAEGELIHGPDGWISEDAHSAAIDAAEARGEMSGREDRADLVKQLMEALQAAKQELDAIADGDPNLVDDSVFEEIDEAIAAAAKS